ncbi:MAG: hypothetical protein ACRD09_02180, partial [Vicinamibacterales bacterium]
MRARWFLTAMLATAFILPAQATARPEPGRGASLQEKKDTPTDKDKKEKKDLPLDGDRTIAFATDEGSWISLDVSPDGKSVLFEMLGDLYTLPIGGGEAKRIT